MDYVFHFDVFRNYADSFFQACLLTFKLAGICIVFTTVFGAICGALLTSGSKVVKGVVKVYVEAFRVPGAAFVFLFRHSAIFRHQNFFQRGGSGDAEPKRRGLRRRNLPGGLSVGAYHPDASGPVPRLYQSANLHAHHFPAGADRGCC